jgi:hypothetical protein
VVSTIISACLQNQKLSFHYATYVDFLFFNNVKSIEGTYETDCPISRDMILNSPVLRDLVDRIVGLIGNGVIPNIPNIPNIPGLPNIPNIPTPPIPDLPNIPGLPFP